MKLKVYMPSNFKKSNMFINKGQISVADLQVYKIKK